MLYRDAGGDLRLRPLQDLNARWTLGRIALAWGSLLRAGECGAWIHPPRGKAMASAEASERRSTLPAGVTCLPVCSGDPEAGTDTRTWLIVAPCPEMRQAAIDLLLV